MSNKAIPYDPFARLAQLVRKLLADVDPLSAKDIARHLRREHSPNLQSSAVRKVLDQTMADELDRLPGKVYRLRDDA